jgi:hypothetical protein
MKLQSIFKPVDELMFKFIDEIFALSFVRKLSEDLQTLPEDQQKIINQSLTFLILLVPFLIVFVLYLGNRDIRKTVDYKEQVLTMAQENQARRNELQFYGQGLLSGTDIPDQTAFQSLVNDIVRSRSLNPSNVNLTHFEQSAAGTSLVQSTAGLSFSELTTQDLTNLMLDLVSRHRVRFQALEIEKNQASKFLQGSFELLHFSRSSMED